MNGDTHEVAGPLTVNELLARLEIDGRRVAVEHNLVVLKRDAFDVTMVRDGDEVEIVNFVGGGGFFSAVSAFSAVNVGFFTRFSGPADVGTPAASAPKAFRRAPEARWIPGERRREGLRYERPLIVQG